MFRQIYYPSNSSLILVAPLSLNTFKWVILGFLLQICLRVIGVIISICSYRSTKYCDLIWPEPGYVSPTIDSAKGLGADQRTHRWDSCLPAQHVLPSNHFPHQTFLPSPPFSSFLLHQALTGFATHPPLIACFIFNYHNQDGILDQKVQQHSSTNNLSPMGDPSV